MISFSSHPALSSIFTRKSAFRGELTVKALIFALEEGNKKAAIESYIVAAERAPKDPLILAILGELFVDGKGEMLETGLALLKKADMLSLDNTRVKFTLARAYALSGDHGMAALTAAERFFLLKDEKFAALHAKRALNLLPQGNSRWLRAQDIIVRTEEAKKER
jgi:predicted Zn-dependent protease